MNKNIKSIIVVLFFAAIISACSVPQSAPIDTVNEQPNINSPSEPSDNVSETENVTNDIELPGWISAEMIDVNSNSNFRISDYLGKVVLVETMAIWCPKCLSQQQEVLKLKSLLPAGTEVISVALDVDPNENEAQLASYAMQNGFNWLYAVAPVNVADEISSLYGNQFLNPTATPMLIIDKQGGQHPLPFGKKTAQDLYNALQPFLIAE